MLLIGLESSRSPHQCFFRPLLPMLLRTTHFLPREPAERQFLFKSSRALARLGPFCLCYVTIEISCANCDNPERAEGSNPSPSVALDFE